MMKTKVMPTSNGTVVRHCRPDSHLRVLMSNFDEHGFFVALALNSRDCATLAMIIVLQDRLSSFILLYICCVYKILFDPKTLMLQSSKFWLKQHKQYEQPSNTSLFFC